MPTPHPYDAVSRENLTHLLENLDSLSELMREISAITPVMLTVARARLLVTTTMTRIRRMIDAMPDDALAGDQIPTPAEALAHLATARGGPQSWLSPTALETPTGVPEVIGPAVYVPEAAMPSAEEGPIDLPEFQRRGATEDLAAHLGGL